MDVSTREIRRKEVIQRRSRPVKAQRIHFPVAGLGESIEVDPERPLELCIEATDPQGQVVEWLTDEWWIQVHTICKDRNVTIVILPTPGALLDAVVLHQLEMVRRIAPKWRIIGYAQAKEALHVSSADQWVNTPYDEIRFCENEETMKNGAGTAAHELVAQASRLPRINGFHRAQVRLIPTLPYQLSFA